MIVKASNLQNLALADNVTHTNKIFIKNGKLFKLFADPGAFSEEKERNNPDNSHAGLPCRIQRLLRPLAAHSGKKRRNRPHYIHSRPYSSSH